LFPPPLPIVFLTSDGVSLSFLMPWIDLALLPVFLNLPFWLIPVEASVRTPLKVHSRSLPLLPSWSRVPIRHTFPVQMSSFVVVLPNSSEQEGPTLCTIGRVHLLLKLSSFPLWLPFISFGCCSITSPLFFLTPLQFCFFFLSLLCAASLRLPRRPFFSSVIRGEQDCAQSWGFFFSSVE